MSLHLDTHPMYGYALLFLIVGGAISFLLLNFVSAPYGRHQREGWGPTVPAKVSWVIMEAPSLLSFVIVYWMSGNATRIVPLVLFGLYTLHYSYRTFVFPFRMRGGDKPKPLLLSGIAFVFNICVGSTNAFAITELAPHLLDGWLKAPQFWAGLFIFAAGYFINHQSDGILRNLRKPGETGYKIPHGGFYRWISSPNYFGELIEWTGFAIAASTLPAWVFVFFTASNLVPRAFQNHRWYLEKFEDYPKNRKAILPFVL